MTRDEHVARCKERALAYLDQGDLTNAFASMASDMTKHPDTNTPALAALMPLGMSYVINGDAPALRRFIEGFA